MDANKPQVPEMPNLARHRQDYDLLMRRIAEEANVQEGKLLFDLITLWFAMFEKRIS